MLTPVLWYKDGILLVDYLKKGATIMVKYCVALLDKLRHQLISKCRDKLSNRISFLQDKAAIIHQKLADLHIEILKQPAYSPDLAPSDYCLYPNLKKCLEGRKFLSTQGAILAVDRWFAAQAEFFFDGLQKLEQGGNTSMSSSGAGKYVEYICFPNPIACCFHYKVKDQSDIIIIIIKSVMLSLHLTTCN
jgi:histone-lysine N-methyltransferase SETMAR